MKLNKKGFAISGILYSLLILFVSLFLGMLTIFASSKFSFDKIKKDIITKLSNREFNNYISSNNNCIKSISSLCNLGTEVNVMVNDTTSYNFFVINDTGNKLTLIMDRNIAERVLWVSQVDYEEAGGTAAEYGTNGNSNKGPLTALKTIEELTSTWINIPAMNYTLTDAGGRYDSITRTNVRARMLTKEEVDTLSCTSSSSEQCPSYLYENLNNNGSSYGYWLSRSVTSNAYSAYSLGYDGLIHFNYMISETGNGVRPVITVFKTL